MTDQPAAAIDDALEQVIAAARDHLTAVKAAGGAVDDEQVWRSYVALNNASFAYDQLLLDEFGEVTPWDTEAIDVEGKPKVLTEPGMAIGEHAKDPHPGLLSVRQRRDYRVPSVAALIAAAREAAQRTAIEGEQVAQPNTVAEAVLELIHDGDGSLAGLDVPELEPRAGVVTVLEVTEPATAAVAATVLFQVGPDERVIGRSDELPYPDEDEDEDEDDREADEDDGEEDEDEVVESPVSRSEPQ